MVKSGKLLPSKSRKRQINGKASEICAIQNEEDIKSMVIAERYYHQIEKFARNDMRNLFYSPTYAL